MAAEDLSISQSSISAAIDAMEREIGYDIFVRTPAKGVKPTALGGEVLQAVRRFLEQSRHFEAEVQSVDGQATGAVRIGCYATAAPSFLPLILKSFSENHPGISIMLLEGSMDAAAKFLSEGDVDLVFSYDETVEEGQGFVPLFSAPPYALIPQEHPLSGQSDVSYEELCSLPMVLLDLPRTRAYFANMFTKRGLTPNIVHSTRSSEIVRALVSGGFGFSILNILPPGYGGSNQPFSILPIRDTVDTPVFGIVTSELSRRPQIVSAFIEHCISLRESGVFSDLVVQ
ncbi:LysR family transcriptional regulator [Amylibacter cionae]|uniref:LysR family transcriptional regulator n=2 Tax=Neptunicoccus cionae TaxID=2035344 RepID=A0A916QS76_9RHOB|nr:LysR family transcriptional regulator [Amylibacter cionae]